MAQQEVQHLDVSTSALAKGSGQINKESLEIKASIETLALPLKWLCLRWSEVMRKPEGNEPKTRCMISTYTAKSGQLNEDRRGQINLEVTWMGRWPYRLEWQLVYYRGERYILADSASKKCGTEGVPADCVGGLHSLLSDFNNALVSKEPWVADRLKVFSDAAARADR